MTRVVQSTRVPGRCIVDFVQLATKQTLSRLPNSPAQHPTELCMLVPALVLALALDFLSDLQVSHIHCASYLLEYSYSSTLENSSRYPVVEVSLQNSEEGHAVEWRWPHRSRKISQALRITHWNRLMLALCWHVTGICNCGAALYRSLFCLEQRPRAVAGALVGGQSWPGWLEFSQSQTLMAAVKRRPKAMRERNFTLTKQVLYGRSHRVAVFNHVTSSTPRAWLMPLPRFEKNVLKNSM